MNVGRDDSGRLGGFLAVDGDKVRVVPVLLPEVGAAVVLLVLLALLPAPGVAGGHVHLLGHLVGIGLLEVGAPLLHLLAFIDGSHAAVVVLGPGSERLLAPHFNSPNKHRPATPFCIPTFTTET